MVSSRALSFSLLLVACGSSTVARDPVQVAPLQRDARVAVDAPHAGEASIAPAPIEIEPMSVQAPSDVAAPPSTAIVTPSGLAMRVLVPGHGTDHPTARDHVTVHYAGWTTDGRLFDSSITRGPPATFPLDAVIAGWTEGVQTMVVGERRRLWIPSDLAYEGSPGAPQGTLVFDVELIAIRSVP